MNYTCDHQIPARRANTSIVEITKTFGLDKFKVRQIKVTNAINVNNSMVWRLFSFMTNATNMSLIEVLKL